MGCQGLNLSLSCKASALPAVLSLWPWTALYFKIWKSVPISDLFLLVGSAQFCLASAKLKCVSFVFTDRAALVAFHAVSAVSCSAQWSVDLEVATERELSTTDLLGVFHSCWECWGKFSGWVYHQPLAHQGVGLGTSAWGLLSPLWCRQRRLSGAGILDKPHLSSHCFQSKIMLISYRGSFFRVLEELRLSL